MIPLVPLVEEPPTFWPQTTLTPALPPRMYANGKSELTFLDAILLRALVIWILVLCRHALGTFVIVVFQRRALC